MRSEDYPPLYQDLDDAAARAQRRYWILLASHFGVLVAAGVASSITLQSHASQQQVHAVSAFLLVIGLILTLVLASNAFEKTWYGGRAAAESVKSLSWKYMTRAKPFTDRESPKKVDAEFTGALARILGDRKELALGRGVRQSSGEPISAHMRHVRLLSLPERTAHYTEHRIRDQINWYAGKSNGAESAHSRWIWIVVVVQAAAAAGAIWQVVNPALPFNVGAALATLAGVLVSWSQLRRYRELSQAYGIASHELEFAAGMAPHILSEADLSEFVNDSESAISREHTMWVARRERAL